ncbi:MAG: TlpA family protein disulfide reductase [Bryobacterales bacterium]|nr:TlpA family protein disulfide reductase [Bryobacterales bacterium]
MPRILFASIIAGFALCPVQAQRPEIVVAVRRAINAGDLPGAVSLVSKARASEGDTPPNLEALSWLGRGNLAAKRYEEAEKYATETRKLVLAQLARRKLDDDTSLPTALGASIEVRAQALAAQGQRSEAVAFLDQELKAWRHTSIRTRIQKNINLISLDGKRAPLAGLVSDENAGGTKLNPSSLRGKPLILFFWAHWCGDCKQQAPVLARLMDEYAAKGLQIIAPTQHYGYVAGGEEAPRDVETRYIGEVFRKYYSGLRVTSAPITDEGFKDWGASTTPTLAIVDRKGIVRLYHPGQMTYDELAARLKAVL